MEKYYLDPDYRKNPCTDVYCIRCQKDIKVISSAIRVSVDFDTLEVWEDKDGKHLIGLDCWKKIKTALK